MRKLKVGDRVTIKDSWVKEMSMEQGEFTIVEFYPENWDDRHGNWVNIGDYNCPEKYLKHNEVRDTKLARKMYPNFEVYKEGWITKGVDND